MGGPVQGFSKSINAPDFQGESLRNSYNRQMHPGPILAWAHPGQEWFVNNRYAHWPQEQGWPHILPAAPLISRPRSGKTLAAFLSVLTAWCAKL